MAENDAEIYQLDEQVGFILRKVGQRHATIFQERMPMGLTMTQFAALVRLAELGECSQNELGRQTAMDVATIKGVVDRLRRKGLVEQKPDPVDKRRSTLAVTPEVLSELAALHVAGHGITAETLAPLTAAEQKTLIKLLKKMA